MPTSSTTHLRITCGSSEPFTDPFGAVWQADVPDAGTARRDGGAAAVRPLALPIAPAPWAGLLQSEAFGMQGYHLAVPRGRYDVRLVVAETHPTQGSMERTWSWSCNGTAVPGTVCPSRVAGGFARGGEVRLAGVTVGDAGLHLEFSPNANLAGIEVLPAHGGSGVSTAAWAPLTVTEAPAAASTVRRVRLGCIGNSGTFYWAIPESVGRMIALERDDLRLETNAFYAGGQGVRFFHEAPQTAELLAGKHDLVMLQDSSWGPLEDPATFTTWMPRLIARVRASGAQPVLYAYSGPKRHSPAQRRQLLRLYAEVALSEDVPMIPCAAALALAEERALGDPTAPVRDFHDADAHHLGMAGGWLYACCWYRLLTGSDPLALHETTLLAGQAVVPTPLARWLAAIANEVCGEVSYPLLAQTLATSSLAGSAS